MAKWEIEYYDEGTSAWISMAGEIDQINEDETDHNASFFIANTSASRLLIQQDLMVNIWFDNKLQFTGILSGGDITGGKIKTICYDPIALILDQYDTFTRVYDQKAANIILSDLLLGTGLLTDGSAPTTAISVVFYNANRLDVLKFIATTSGLEYWSDDGVTIKFGTRGGSTYYPTTMKLSKRGIDRSKQVDYVRVRGIEATTGYHIVGVAGTPGGRTKVFDETTPTDVNGLNAIAAKKLAQLQTDSSGAPIVILMTAAATSDNEAADLGYGDYVHLEDPRYLLNGNYRILQITKGKVKASIQVDKVRRSIDKEIADLKSLENKGIYLPGSTSWSLNLQGLVVLLHLNEGQGTEATNRAPIDSPIKGTITDGSWEDGPVTKILTFNGTSSNVSLGDESKSAINLTGKLSVGAWFSPSANDSTDRFIAHKDGQFALKYKVSTGVVTFSLTIGSTVYDFESDLGFVAVGARLFVMCTYDGAIVKMYLNGFLHKQWSRSGNPDSSANTVYFGVFLKGVLAEVMLWTRALVDQEVLELYFFPLLRVVGASGGGGEPELPPENALEKSGVATSLAETGTTYQISEEQEVINNPGCTQTITESIEVAKGSTMQSINEDIEVSLNPPDWTLTVGVMPPLVGRAMSPSEGTNGVPSGMSQLVRCTEAQYWAVKSWMVNHNSIAGTDYNGYSEVTVGPYLGGLTAEAAVIIYAGWELSVSGSTNDGTDQIPYDENSMSYTRRSYDSDVEVYDGAYLDGVRKTTSASYAAPAQDVNTSHILEFRFHPK